MQQKPVRMTSYLMYIIQVIHSLLLNRHLHIVSYVFSLCFALIQLHILVPCILTCILGKTLSFSPAENHWELRSRASIVLAELIRQYANRGNWGNRYGVTYPKLQNQVLVTLNRVIHTPNSTIPSVFGVLISSWKRGNLKE